MSQSKVPPSSIPSLPYKSSRIPFWLLDSPVQKGQGIIHLRLASADRAHGCSSKLLNEVYGGYGIMLLDALTTALSDVVTV